MGIVVLVSNFLVQFPVNYFGLSELLTYGAFSYPIAFLITVHLLVGTLNLILNFS